MKNILTLLSIHALSSLVNAQPTMFIESGVNSLGSNNHIGVQYIKKTSKIGFYTTVGGNWMDRFIGSDEKLILDSKGDFTSSVSWYTKDGTHYETMPATPIFTSPEWGNAIMETGSCVNIVETWMGNMTTNSSIYNFGLVINGGQKNNVKYRIGVGIRNLVQQGYCDYQYWKHSFSVSKYYDEWGVVAQPNGIFVVVHSGNVTKWGKTEYITINKNEFNLNFAVEYEMYNNTTISLGYNTRGGINLGFGFPLKK